MPENVVQFRKKQAPKQPKQTPPWLRRVLIIAGVIAAFALAYTYFAITGGQVQ